MINIDFGGKNGEFIEQFCWSWVICCSSFCLWIALDTNFTGHQAVCVQFSDGDPHQERCFLSSGQGSAGQDYSSSKNKVMGLIHKRKILKKDIDQMLKVVSNSMNSYSSKLKSCIKNWMPINFIVILKLLKSPKLLHVIVL